MNIITPEGDNLKIEVSGCDRLLWPGNYPEVSLGEFENPEQGFCAECDGEVYHTCIISTDLILRGSGTVKFMVRNNNPPQC